MSLPVMDEEFLSNPYPAFAGLRAQGPVHRMLLPSGLRVWAVVSHEEARIAMTHPALSKDIDTSVELGYFDREMSEGERPGWSTARWAGTCSTWTRRATPGCASWSTRP